MIQNENKDYSWFLYNTEHTISTAQIYSRNNIRPAWTCANFKTAIFVNQSAQPNSLLVMWLGFKPHFAVLLQLCTETNSMLEPPYTMNCISFTHEPAFVCMHCNSSWKPVFLEAFWSEEATSNWQEFWTDKRKTNPKPILPSLCSRQMLLGQVRIIRRYAALHLSLLLHKENYRPR